MDCCSKSCKETRLRQVLRQLILLTNAQLCIAHEFKYQTLFLENSNILLIWKVYKKLSVNLPLFLLLMVCQELPNILQVQFCLSHLKFKIKYDHTLDKYMYSYKQYAWFVPKSLHLMRPVLKITQSFCDF